MLYVLAKNQLLYALFKIVVSQADLRKKEDKEYMSLALIETWPNSVKI